jgi:hypothetical protein
MMRNLRDKATLCQEEKTAIVNDEAKSRGLQAKFDALGVFEQVAHVSNGLFGNSPLSGHPAQCPIITNHGGRTESTGGGRAEAPRHSKYAGTEEHRTI